MVAGLRKQRLYSASRRVEETQALRGLGELLLDEIVGVGAHQPLGEIVGLDHEEPVPGEGAPLPRHVVEQMMLRDDVEDGGARNLVRMVETHAVKHARAAIVTGSIEAIETECRHDFDLVLRHGTERVAAVVRAARRLFRIAVAAQIGGHHRELAREPRRHLVPGHVRERIAVHEQKRRPLAAVHRHDTRAAGLDFACGKPSNIAWRPCSTHREACRGKAVCAIRAAPTVTSPQCPRLSPAPWQWGPRGRSARRNRPGSSPSPRRRACRASDDPWRPRPFTVSWWMRATMSRGSSSARPSRSRNRNRNPGNPPRRWWARPAARSALRAAHRERQELAFADERHRRGDWAEVEVHASGDHLGERLGHL